MVLREQMVHVGQQMFIRRSYLPLLTLGLFGLAFWGYRYPFESHFLDQIWEGVCLAVAFFGLTIRVVTVGFYQGGAPELRLGEEWHHNRLEMVSSMGAWGAPHRA